MIRNLNSKDVDDGGDDLGKILLRDSPADNNGQTKRFIKKEGVK